MKKDVVIIDSGVCQEHPLLKKVPFECLTVCNNHSNYIMMDGGEDLLGHGTAVCGTIFSGIENPSIFQTLIIKIYDDKLAIDLDALLFALAYIEKNVECRLIHISSGVLEYSSQLHEVCKRLTSKGTCIVSAFDNSGAISYPAAFTEVIGVDATFDCRKTTDWIYIEKGIVNILAKGGNHRLAWLDSKTIISQGASFSAGYISSVIAQLQKDGKSKTEIQDYLRNNSKKIYKNNSESSKSPFFNFKIQNAALFPYNKEMHSLVNYYNLLPFEIKGVYSSKYLGQLGQTVTSLDKRYSFKIQNIDYVDWDSIDTFILGHVQEVSKAALIDYKKQIAENCLSHRVNLFSFDSDGLEQYKLLFENERIGLYFPNITFSDYTKKNGKLYSINKPILSVMGTSSNQGKYTLQLMLREKFLEKGYMVAQMGTEPTSFLFGMDTMYPFGYASSVFAYESDAVEIINSMMHTMELSEPDIILTGSQSGTVPACFHNTSYLTIQQLIYLMGTKPDAVILCINLYDDIQYIQRTIAVIENLTESSVIALALSPLTFPNDLSQIRKRKENADQSYVRTKAIEFEQVIQRPVYVMLDDVNKLFETCICFFTGDEIENAI